MREENCIFCKLANGEIPSATVYEDEAFRVILDLNPATRGHALILPKEHFENVFEMPEEWVTGAFALARKMAKKMKDALKCDGFNLVQNNGEAAGQTVMHFHMHMIPRYANGPQMVLWNPGKLDDTEKTEIIENVKKELE